MIDALYLLAVLCGCIAALRGSRTAAILLLSAASVALLPLIGVGYDPLLWLTIDWAVIILIMRPNHIFMDDLIVVLFIPIWFFYLYGGELAQPVVSLIVTLQFLLTFPLPQLCGKLVQYLRKLTKHNGALKLATHHNRVST